MFAEFWERFSWNALMENDFGRGFFMALAAVLVLVVLLSLLRFVLHLAFGAHRCPTVTVAGSDGDIVISRAAIAEAVESELRKFPELRLLKLQLFRYKREFRMTLICEFSASGGLTAAAERLRPHLREALRETFGIENLADIRIVVKRFSAAQPGGDADRDPAAND